MSESDKQALISAMEAGFRIGFRVGYVKGRNDSAMERRFDSAPPDGYLAELLLTTEEAI
ncbi:hypothetical protein MH117_09790 [Paenibacillus sp. ACRRX]|uniref:hypothetical protein n=1 Tax=Paenibacillus sp. ACRRX TaxID=2918206 RepID=UPI001EF4BF58|nr:hypothetical protein [Paenibacillus sp. ACRRX]MCG7407715.1 hypothetical protein [Paenibacillus sp. ACRRX]